MTISLADESRITRFFLFDEKRFQRSVHGAMVERLERDSMGSSRCNVCHGAGIIGDEKALACHQGKGRSLEPRLVWRITDECPPGAQPAKRRGIARDVQITEYHAVGIGSPCQFCNATGWVAMKRPAARCECWGQPRSVKRACPVCLGTGAPQVDARPTHAEVTETRDEVDGDTLKRYAVVSRRLERMSLDDRLTLERYYGAHGFSWANQPGGRELGLLEFTAAGKALVKRTRVKGDEATGASDAERIAVQIDIQARSPEPWRGTLLDEARAQARHALQQAHRAWVHAFGDEPWEDRWDELQDDITATGEALEAWYAEHGCEELAEPMQWAEEA